MRFLFSICFLLIISTFPTGCNPDHTDPIDTDPIDPDPIDTLDTIAHSLLIGKWKLISRHSNGESLFNYEIIGVEHIIWTSMCLEIDAFITFNENPNFFHEDGNYISQDTLVKNIADTTFEVRHILLDTLSHPWKDYGDSIDLRFIVAPIRDYFKIRELSPSFIELSRHYFQGFDNNGFIEYRKSTIHSIYERME